MQRLYLHLPYKLVLCGAVSPHELLKQAFSRPDTQPKIRENKGSGRKQHKCGKRGGYIEMDQREQHR